jgi:predicted methyltransferase
VITIELDPAVLRIARHNPWSQDLFHHPKIIQFIGDSFDQVRGFSSKLFTRIIHDPPMFKLAGSLYSSEFYFELHRILNPGGKVFHYIGNPKTRSGRNTTRGVVQRLHEAGFERVQRAPKAFGVVAQK